MARCSGCTSVYHDDSNCILLSGTGSATDPLIATPKLDPDINNKLSCSAAGLMVAASSTGLLAAVSYDPSSFTIKTATSSVVNLDTTNLIVTFTVPSSGKILVRFTALVNPETGANYYWYVQNASDTQLAKQMVVSGGGDYTKVSVPFYITGLTPGALTIRWAHSQATGASTTSYGDTGGGNPAIIEVWAAP